MIIVTGGAGFIGCALIHQLNELGREDILVVDRCEDVEANKIWRVVSMIPSLMQMNFWRPRGFDKRGDSCVSHGSL